MARARKTYGTRGFEMYTASVAKPAGVDEVDYGIDEIFERRRDPMVRALTSAPPDDEPSTADEDVEVAEALAAYRRGEGISSDLLRTELDLVAEGHPRHRGDA